MTGFSTQLVALGIAALLIAAAALGPSPLDSLSPISAPQAGAAEPAPIALHRETKLVFASAERGAQHLAKSDSYLESVSAFDRQSRMQRADDPGNEAFVNFISAEVRDWDEANTAKVRAAADALRERLKPLRLPLPSEILLVRTTGREEGEAAYCRGPSIILPDKVLARGGLDRLLAHELFHVLSNQNAELRRKMYAVVNYQVCDEIPLPASLRPRKITNPDGPKLDCVVPLKLADRQLLAAPLLLASVDKFDPKQGGSFFRYLQFKFLVVQPSADGKFQPVEKDGRPELLDVAGPVRDAYLDQVGKNTGYIIHADEVLADNFVHLVFNSRDLASPQVVEKLGKLLTGE